MSEHSRGIRLVRLIDAVKAGSRTTAEVLVAVGIAPGPEVNAQAERYLTDLTNAGYINCTLTGHWVPIAEA